MERISCHTWLIRQQGFVKICIFLPLVILWHFIKRLVQRKYFAASLLVVWSRCENRTVFCGILSYPRVSLDFSEAQLYIQAAVTAALRNPLLKGHVSLFLKSRDEIELRPLLSNWSPATRSGLKTPALCSDMAGLWFESILPFIVKSRLSLLPRGMKRPANLWWVNNKQEGVFSYCKTCQNKLNLKGQLTQNGNVSHLLLTLMSKKALVTFSNS